MSDFDKDTALQALARALENMSEADIRKLCEKYGIDLDDESHLEILRKAEGAELHKASEPVPPKTLGPGAQFTMTPEQLAKGSYIPGQNVDNLRKGVDLSDAHPAQILRAIR